MRPASSTTDPAQVLASPALGPRLRARSSARAEQHFAEADKIMARSPRRAVKAPRIMAAAYRPRLALMVERGWDAPRERVSLEPPAIPLDPFALRHRVMPRTVHIIGAGLAGLSAAVRLIGARHSCSCL